MNKLFSLLLLSLLSFSSFAQECASNISSLKSLMENKDFPLQWNEDTEKNPYTLKLKDGKGLIHLELRSRTGEVLDALGLVCKNGNNYVARVNKISWGSEAPSIAKSLNIKSVRLKIPYHSQLKVSVALFSFDFVPL